MSQHIDLVEKLVEKTGLSYTEAKAALERSDWDILEAMINLETQGKIRPGQTAEYTTKNGPEEESSRREKSQKPPPNEEYKKTTRSFGEWIHLLFDKGNANSLEIYKDGSRKLSMPITAFLVLLLVGFWVVIPLMIVGLFFDFKYRFAGPDLGKEVINDAMGKANNVAESIKNEFKSSSQE